MIRKVFYKSGFSACLAGIMRLRVEGVYAAARPRLCAVLPVPDKSWRSVTVQLKRNCGFQA
ncbi:MAG: hypothetical protein DU429_01870 [Candidatus Tokpelaia sp.]|nr:MAG: hypothetical protein DU430_03585 [Candidatus Tokpelaia sp.]KAA6207256.1 MAG: hypothetical protein DU429_01870 [Candidatus Tokpelaia sp.]KAA6405220.1 hypothetical protein DPQ22_06765 [Candidatus Tokpelaia sp.]